MMTSKYRVFKIEVTSITHLIEHNTRFILGLPVKKQTIAFGGVTVLNVKYSQGSAMFYIIEMRVIGD
ncbi:hypothetical protein C9J19_17755 [Photobacterium phosphoreum]|nr:hypothetical protein [Photobacterium phosphoreum]MCD9470164.1 hypothetical protein [Photobacterium phosphoreum]PSU61327.1 hypothetical protein CTM80_12335 [Photobacterium phosphoreum]PSU74215.1 hypothetical protein CTM79_01825 [Photobacterium phosphoreum]PSW17785.1 hypothetical protein C9J20_00540 [Photobacterium phosphoreum]